MMYLFSEMHIRVYNAWYIKRKVAQFSSADDDGILHA
jgi:hypothetical protein